MRLDKMAICRLVVIIGVFIALFDCGHSRVFLGGYKQAAMIQKAANSMPKRSAHVVSKRFSTSGNSPNFGKSKVSVANDAAVPSRSRRVPESPGLAEAIVNRLANSLDDKELIARRGGSYSASKFLSKLLNDKPAETAQENADVKETASADEADNEPDVSYADLKDAISKILAMLTNKDEETSEGDSSGADEMRRMLRSGLQKMSEVEDQSPVDKLKSLLAALEEHHDRKKRQAASDKALKAARESNLFISGHYSPLGKQAAEEGQGSSVMKRSPDVKSKKSHIRRRRYVPIAKRHSRSVKHIIPAL
ncbi:uncharacterized protein [Amphiura filiformis]|uniref:uncharacterized protein n=1 Tax=Amphiura filiformis TaxID=82378 RepID=UPI003B2185AA